MRLEQKSCLARFFLVFVQVFTISFPILLAGEEPATKRKATVELATGEIAEGIFRGANQTQLFLIVAGRELPIEWNLVKYVSFNGKLFASPPPGSESMIEKAFAAFDEMEAATQIGMTFLVYSQRKQELLLPVSKFINDSTDEFHDVKLAMQMALEQYHIELVNWQMAPALWRDAQQCVEYARKIYKNGNNKQAEDSSEKPITVGSSLTGRLGVGDRTMPAEIDKSCLGGFNDVYLLEVSTPICVKVKMNPITTMYRAHLALLDPSGKKIDGNMGNGNCEVVIKKNLKTPGSYTIWAGAGDFGKVGEYILTVEQCD